MAKIRVYELAKELGKDNREMERTVRELGIKIKGVMSSLDEDQAQAVRGHVRRSMGKFRVYELAKELGMDNREMERTVRELGIEIKSIMSLLNGDQAEVVRRHVRGSMVPPPGKLRPLRELLLSLLDLPTLEQLLWELEYDEILRNVALSGSFSNVVDQVLQRMQVQDLQALAAVLMARFPGRAQEITAIVAETGIVPYGENDATPRRKLNGLLNQLFTADHLQRFVRASRFADAEPTIAWGQPLNVLTHRVIIAVEQYGMLEELFRQLAQEFPARVEQIRAVAKAWEVALSPAREDEAAQPAPHSGVNGYFAEDDERIPEQELAYPAVFLRRRNAPGYYLVSFAAGPVAPLTLGALRVVSTGGADPTRTPPPIPRRFSKLPPLVCSLGTDGLYKMLAKIPAHVPALLEALRDVAWHPKTFARLDEAVRRDLLRDEKTGTPREWTHVVGMVAELRLRITLVRDGQPESEEAQASEIVADPKLSHFRAVHDVPGVANRDDTAEAQGLADRDDTAEARQGETANERLADRNDTAEARQGEARNGGSGFAPTNEAGEAQQGEAGNGGPEGPPSGLATRADADTVTLSIKKGAVRLYAGCCLAEERPPLWERPLAIDWANQHFTHAEQPCDLAAALTYLPNVWGRPAVEAFGARLAELVFGAIDPDPKVSEALVLGPGVQRRMVLLLDETTFGVPWEYLRLGDRFIAEQPLSIVRHVPRRNGDARPLKLNRPARISFAYANPGPPDLRFDGDSHRKAIFAAMCGFCRNFDYAEQCSATELENLLREPSSVFHFLGHGTAGGSTMSAALVLHDGPTGKAECPADRIAGWIHRAPRDLVVLGACFGGAVPEQRLMAGVGWRIARESSVPVVAMQMEVPQDFSTAFCARFYEELERADFDVELAVYRAREASHEGRHAFGIAVLLADAEGLTARRLPELPVPSVVRWAKFAPRVLLDGDEAVRRWRASQAEDTRAIADAIELDARHNPDARYPEPPTSGAERQGRYAELWGLLSDATARAKLEERGPQRSVTPTLLQPVVVEPVGDLTLSERGSLADCRAAIEGAERELSLPEGLVLQIAGELLAGKHVLLTGPVGTGKSSLARAIAEALGYAVQVETASADWTRFEIQGGHWPVPMKAGMGFEFRAGVFLEAVLANWDEQAGDPKATRRTWRRRPRPDGMRGMWLVLDELNRADVDRALGGIFTALETRRLRVPVSEGQGSIDIPIPEDFRVIATINAADRHFLFRMSDALKRRFAFVYVPVTDVWEGEWRLLARRERLTEDPASADLRRFVALVRVLHPLGTALVQAALRFLVATESVQAAGDWRLAQAIVGSILPSLEDLPAKRLAALQRWAETADPGALAAALAEALAHPASVPSAMLAALAICPKEWSPHWTDGDDDVGRQTDLPAWIARRVTRPADGAALPSLARALADLVSHAPVA